MQFSRNNGWARFLVLGCLGLVLVMAGCGGTETATEEAADDHGEAGHSPDAEVADAGLEPRHNGRIVMLDGEYDAELVVTEAMTWVYLYDAEGNPVEYEGKTVTLRVTTADGKMQEINLEGMGQGAGAHFMNPLSEEFVAHVLEQGAYTAEVTVMSESGPQMGTLEIALD